VTTIGAINFGPFSLDRASYSLVRREPAGKTERITLQPKSFDVLCYLIERAGEIVSLDEFLEALWPNVHVQPEVLKGHVLAVRNALGDRGTPARYVETVRGRGYRFIAEIGFSSDPGENPDGLPEILVGRTTARSELEVALKRAQTGEKQLAFLSGEAGIGKSTLALDFALQAAKSGVRFVVAHCLPGSGEMDVYSPLLEILIGLSRSPARVALLTALREHAPTWLVQLPSLIHVATSRLSKDVAGATSHRMAREFCEALEAFARSEPLILVVEDLHWADAATLDVVQALANRRSRAQLLLVATLRSPGPTGATYAAADLAHRCSLYRLAREIKLTPLQIADVGDFLTRYALAEPPAGLAAVLHARSEGNPLFMRATLDHLVQQELVSWDRNGWRLHEKFDELGSRPPPDLVQLIEADMRALPHEMQRALETASLSDGAFSAAVYGVASELGEQPFEEACQTLARQGQFLRRGEGAEAPSGVSQSYSFRHALFREAAYDRQSAAQRAAGHAAVAERLASLHASDPAPIASSLARHFTQARLWRQAIGALAMASKTAVRRFAIREAAVLLEQALELSRNLPEIDRRQLELDLLDELARIYLSAFDRRARAAYDRLHELARELDGVEAEVRALVGLAYVTSAIDSDRCLAIMSQALARSADIADPVQRAQLRCSAHGWRNWILGWSAPDVAGFEAALATLRDAGDSSALNASEFDLGLILLPAGRYFEAMDIVSRSLSALVDHSLAARVDVSFPLWTSRLGIPWALTSLGQFGESIELSMANCRACEANGHIMRSGTLHLYFAFTHILMHDYAAALALVDAAAAMLKSNGLEFPPNEIKVELVLRGLAYLGLGDLDSAFRRLNAARAEMERRNTLTSWYWRLVGEWGLTDAHLAAGDFAAAELCAAALLERACAIEERTWRGLAAEACARVALARGEHQRTAARLAEAWGHVEGFDTPLVRWRLHAVEAELRERLGESEAAVRHRRSQAEELEALAASLPADHPGRETLRKAQPLAPKRGARA
jgi:DNA-binding winged helix-turn-helix (wHTH) protein